jgi:exopolyphosphatase / guanosine-5'-triphosphate,3'-diphosphate pyrophosphatase
VSSCSRSPPSAVRDAEDSVAVLERVHAETGVELRVLSGSDEARYTFLAVRRWFGWSAGRLPGLDIGGGSLELAAGRDEDPDVAVSLPLGAGRLTRLRWRTDPPARGDTDALRAELDAIMEPVARRIRELGECELMVGTSKTFPVAGPPRRGRPSRAGSRVRRSLTDVGLCQVLGFISRMSSTDLAELEGVSAGRAHQLVAGALVAAAAIRIQHVGELQICP